MSIIDDYRTSSDSRKFELLQEIEFEDIPDKWQLLREVIADRGDYDLARVQALKILEIAGVPAEDLQSFCELLLTLIATEQDYDVRNYAVIASKNFVNDSDALKHAVVNIVLDPKEDIDVRYNAYAAVLAFFDLPGRKVVLERLSSDGKLGKSASRDLASLHGGVEG